MAPDAHIVLELRITICYLVMVLKRTDCNGPRERVVIVLVLPVSLPALFIYYMVYK